MTDAERSVSAAAPPLVVLLREGFRWFTDRLNSQAVAGGDKRISTSAGLLMSYLEPGGVRAADIARKMGVSRQHVHTVVRELVEAGVLTQRPDPRSGRDILVSTTAEGERRRLQALVHLAKLESELTERLGADDLALLRSLLVRAWGRDSSAVALEME